MTYIGTKKYSLEVAFGNVPGLSNYKKFGSNTDVDSGSTPEDLWGGSGLYTGFDATAGENIDVQSTSQQDRGQLVSEGTATGGTTTSLIDTGATFTIDGVAVGDCIVNDTQGFHGIVTAVTSGTELAVIRFNDDSNDDLTPSAQDDYRVVTTQGTGLALIRLNKMLESDYLEYKTEYIIMSGTTAVPTIGTDYIRNSRAIGILAGSNDGAVGVISANQTTTTANVFWSIPVDHNQTLVAADTVPKGHTLYITSVNAYLSRANGLAGSCELDFLVRPIGQIFVSKIHEYMNNTVAFVSGDDFVEVIQEYSDYKWNVPSVTDNNTQVSANAVGYLKEN